MVLYCAGHEAAVLRMLVHKLKNHPDEDMCYMTTVGTYPFGEINMDYTFAYKCVMQVNTAYGKAFTNEKVIVDGTVKMMDEAFAANGICVNEFSHIYVTEDIYHPYTIYFETKNIPYTTIEFTPYSFNNKSKFNIKEHLYTRSVEYFKLCENIGAFTGEGKSCIKRIFDSESVNCFPECQKEYYNYVESISNLSREDLNICVKLYNIPYNLENAGEISMLLTNSRGFIYGNAPEIDYLDIPRIYQKVCDYYLSDLENVYIKPHPNSYGVPYEKYFDSNQIIDAKFLVDLVPFIQNVNLNTIINVASTASVLLKKYCKNQISLGLDFFKFAGDVQAAGALLSYIGNDDLISTIYVAGFNKEQFMKMSVVNFGSKYAVKSIDSFENETDADRYVIVANSQQSFWAAVEKVNGIAVNEKLECYQLIGKEYVKSKHTYEDFEAYIASYKKLKAYHKLLPHSGNVVDVRAFRISNESVVTAMGGNVVRYVIPKLNNYTKASAIMWINPISDDIDSVDWEGMSNSDWLLFDIEPLRYMLADCNNIWYTDTIDFRNKSVYKNNKDKITFVNPMELEDSIIAERLTRFADKLLQRFPKDKMIFLRNGLAFYTGINYRFAPNFGNDVYNRFMEKWEDFLIEKLNPHVISVWKYYFSLSDSNKITYEDEMYEDIVNKVNAVLNGREQMRDNASGYKPDCEIAFKRYLKYYDWVQLKKNYTLFWNEDFYLSKYLIAFGKTFLEKYELVLKDMIYCNITEQDIEAYLKERELNELSEAIHAVQALYAGEKCVWDGLFEYNFPIKKMLIKQMAVYYKKKNIIIPDINVKNEKYFWKLMLSGRTPEPREKNILASTYRTPVDVWGSCVARNIFDFVQEHLYVERYAFRVSMMNMDEKPIQVPEEWMKPEEFASEFVLRMIRIEFQRNAFEYFDKSSAKWIVIDLSNICSFTESYKGTPYSSILNLIKEYPFWRHMQKDSVKVDYTDDVYTDEYFIKRLRTACNYIKKRYGKNVIIVRTLWADAYVDKDDTICLLDAQDRQRLSRRKHITGIAEDYLYRQLECYMVDYVGMFYASPVSIAGGLEALHYEDDFYKEAGYAIEKIIRTEPDERLICDYRVKIKLERAKRLLKNPNNLPFLRKNFNKTPLDSVIMQMPVELIEKYQDDLERLYHMQSGNFAEVVGLDIELPEQLKNELKRIIG